MRYKRILYVRERYLPRIIVAPVVGHFPDGRLGEHVITEKISRVVHGLLARCVDDFFASILIAY